jgi:4-hydroxy-3-methylbut-2-enyl diphosphate reductase
MRRIIVASPRGFCAGVVRAVATVERALAIFGPPVYVRRAIVHNGRVVARLLDAGAKLVDELDEVPRGAVAVLSAHGVPPLVHSIAESRGIRLVDATCPLVSKVHREVRRYSDEGLDVVLVGHAGHDEVVGTLGQAPGVHLVERPADVALLEVADPSRVACITQTTLSRNDVAPVTAALRRRFPSLREPATPDRCFATRNRQAAIAWLARQADVVLVIGDPSSSNSQRLREVAEAIGTAAHLVADAFSVREAWIATADVVGVTAGASTPEDAVAEIVRHLSRGGARVEEAAVMEERVSFLLPPEVALPASYA